MKDVGTEVSEVAVVEEAGSIIMFIIHFITSHLVLPHIILTQEGHE